LAERLSNSCRRRAISKHQAVIVLADAIRIVKESVHGCGGPTDIVSLEPEGKIEWQETIHLESLLDKIERITKPYLLACADTQIDDEQFEFIISKLRREGERLREEERNRFP
jgi:hypothetical protein